MVGYRDSLWPGSSHTVAQRERRSVPTGGELRASWGRVRRGVYVHHQGWVFSWRGFDQLCILFLFWQVHAKCHSAVIPVGININSEINSSNL